MIFVLDSAAIDVPCFENAYLGGCFDVRSGARRARAWVEANVLQHNGDGSADQIEAHQAVHTDVNGLTSL